MSLENYCPYRITKKTIQAFSDCQIPEEEIPFEGVCSVSPDRRQVCFYSGSQTQNCSLRNNSDFCDKPWAKKDF